jgi:predicted N-acetyltransferase YhbS
VDPAHQRKKVGDALVRWGIERADEKNFETVVESSKFGKGLYMKHGFVWVKDVEFGAEGFPERKKGGYAWLVRPKQGKEGGE